MTIERITETRVRDTVALLDHLRVSLFGVSSHRLHSALAGDASAGVIDGRVAIEDGAVRGVVIAAPSSYWRSALLAHWSLAIECVIARLVRSARNASRADAPQRRRGSAGTFRHRRGLPSLTWTDPGDAWRIVIVGTAEEARGRGVAAQLYRSMMADRSLVARIASDNVASIRLHETLGWRLYPDDDVVLAVHDRGAAVSYSAGAAAG